MAERLFRILIADDHSLIRQGLKSLIRKDPSLAIIGEAGDGSALMELLRQAQPDLVILDITMPRINGIDAVREIVAEYPGVKILVLTMHGSSQYFFRAITAGAHGYLIKDDSESELLSAIAAIREGKSYISPQLSPEVTDEIITSFREQCRTPLVLLSEREQQVLKLVVQGCSSRVIGRMLDLSPRTIDHHRASLLKKFKMKNTVDLVNHVVRNAMVFPDE